MKHLKAAFAIVRLRFTANNYKRGGAASIGITIPRELVASTSFEKADYLLLTVVDPETIVLKKLNEVEAKKAAQQYALLAKEGGKVWVNKE